MNNVTDPSNISDLTLYTNRALWGEIRPNMRRVSVDYKKETNTFTLYLYMDKPFSQKEKDYDVVGTIIAEVSADFPQVENWIDEVFVIPSPNEIPDKGICVFQRYESPQIV